MIFKCFAAAVVVLSPVAASAQSETASVYMPAPPVVAAPAVPGAASPVMIRRDTPVVLMAVSEVSTADVTPGTKFRLRVQQPVVVGGRTIIPVGTPAFGVVMTASDSGGLGKSGKMTARLLNIQLGNVEIPLEGDTSAKGTGAGSAGVAILFTGWAGLFHRGNNAKIKAGELVSGFIADDVLLDMTTTPIRRAVAPAPVVTPDATQAPAAISEPAAAPVPAGRR